MRSLPNRRHHSTTNVQASIVNEPPEWLPISSEVSSGKRSQPDISSRK